MAATDDDHARSFVDDTRIIFNADGSYVWRLANGEGSTAALGTLASSRNT